MPGKPDASTDLPVVLLGSVIDDQKRVIVTIESQIAQKRRELTKLQADLDTVNAQMENYKGAVDKINAVDAIMDKEVSGG